MARESDALSCIASGAIVQGTYVKCIGTASGRPQVAKSTTATIVGAEKHLGVAMHDAADGDDINVQPLDGTVIGYLKAGGALVPGTHDELTTDANGKAVAAAAGDVVLSTFIRVIDSSGTDGTSADGDLIEALLHKYNWAA